MIFRWGHFADLHFEFENYDTDVLRLSLTKALREHSLHALLIAGDIFHKGQNSSVELERVETYLHDMADACGCDYQRIYISAGNHDLERSETRAAVLKAIIEDYKKDPRILKTKRKDRASVIHRDTCVPFQDAVNQIRGSNDAPFIHDVYELDDVNIIILNTAVFAGQTYPEQENPDRSLEDTALYIADHHLAALVEEMQLNKRNEGGKLNIVLAHHGYSCFVPSEFHKLANALDDMGVDLYLCGHVHQNQRIIIPRTYDIPQISCGGLFADGYNSPSFLIGEFDTRTKEVTITAYEFNQNQARWTRSVAFPRPWKDSIHSFTPKRLEATILTQPKALSMRQRLEEDILQKCPDENSSFAFTKLVKDFLASQAENSSLGSQLLDILRADILLGPNHVAISYKSLHTVALDFVAYYCLAYHYKQTDRVTGKDSLQSLVDAYGELFQSQLLSNEVQAWLARRTDRLDKAYECDCKMIEHTTVDHNAAVFVSYASTICTLMDREDHNGADSFWATPEDRTRDLERALSFMPEITGNYQKTYGTDRGYPKHFYLWTRLLFYKFLFVPMTPAARASTIAQMSDIAKGYRDCTGALDDVD